MKKIETPLDGAFIIEPQVFGDVRGWFYESYSKQKMHDIGIDVEFVQDNRSFSAQQGTLRGLHCQTSPMAQTKLLTCLRGRIMDVAVDIRRGSPTYMQWTAVELSGENKKMFFIPKGFLHGYMKKIETPLDGAFIIEPQVFGDVRGWFYESYSKQKMHDIGIDVEFVQDNRSFSAQQGTLRGLHCQTSPMAQTKLLTCLRGRIMDVAVDIRRGSPTYMQWTAVELSGENKKMFFIPKGFLHGFVTLTPDVEVSYKVDEYYAPANDRSVKFDDPDIGVDWGVKVPILSDKDMKAPLLKDSDIEFIY